MTASQTPTSTAIEALLSAAVERGVTTGVYAIALGPDGEVHAGGAGTRDGDAPWEADSIAWLASMTKSVVAVAALQLVEQGRIGLDDPVGSVLHELAEPQVLVGFDGDEPILRPANGPVTLRGLLSHNAGVGYPFLSAELTRYHEVKSVPPTIECKLATLVDSPLIADPGTGVRYSLSIDWVGVLVERLTGTDLETHLTEQIFTPLGMSDTGFRIRDRARLARMTVRLPDGLVPFPFEVPQDPELFSGGAGLYSSARDYLTFLQMIVGGGALGSVRILAEDTVAHALTSQTPPFGPMVSVDPMTSHDVDLLPGTEVTWSLLGVRNEEPTPAGRPVGALTWAGVANSYYWADEDTAGVLLTQVLPFADPQIIGLFAEVEKAVRTGGAQ